MGLLVGKLVGIILVSIIYSLSEIPTDLGITFYLTGTCVSTRGYLSRYLYSWILMSGGYGSLLFYSSSILYIVSTSYSFVLASNSLQPSLSTLCWQV
jgi:hypothetical protein